METLTRNSVLTMSIILEAGLLLIAAVWRFFANIDLLAKFQFQLNPVLLGAALALASTGISFLCLTLGKKIPGFAELRKMTEEFLTPLVALLGIGDIVFLSALSGFCEEVLFRGVLQAEFGIWTASLLFGIFHDPTFKQKGYIVLAALAGFAMGFLYDRSGNIWSCITAHALHNLLAMISLRYFFKPSTSD
ncbi:MAG: CPBP family intramembrane metalloprotease [Candidatus Obscuribacterales bacterium]|nr:CPBP family intramembrane metalloprotease [Candidatus Obscuribacterales bacterium]